MATMHFAPLGAETQGVTGFGHPFLHLMALVLAHQAQPSD
jgi:hypothetical protein